MSMSNGQRPSPARRAQVSKRTYAVRRLVVGAVVMVLLWVSVTVVAGLFGGDTTRTTEAVAPTTNTFITDGSPTTQPAPTTTESPPKEATVPSAQDSAEVLILGDSDAGTFGPYLKTLLDETGIVTTELDYKTSSGLARPDFFDWPTHMRQVVPAVNPDIVIVTFGGNDAQGLRALDLTWVVNYVPGKGGDDAEWRAEYGTRVGEAMDYLSEGNRTLIWVGIPNDDNPEVTARMRVQDEVVRAEAAKRPEVVFIDTWTRFSGRNGGWAEFVVDPRDGIGKDVRAGDGFHLNENGAQILALDIADAVRAELRARGADI